MEQLLRVTLSLRQGNNLSMVAQAFVNALVAEQLAQTALILWKTPSAATWRTLAISPATSGNAAGAAIVVELPLGDADELGEMGILQLTKPDPLTTQTIFGDVLQLLYQTLLHHSATEQWQQKEYLQAQELDKFNNLLQSVSEGIMITTLDGGIIFANRAANEIVGLSLMGMPSRDVYASIMLPDMRERLRQQLQKRAMGETDEYALQLHTPKGERWITVRGNPIRNEQGVPIATVAVFNDITSQRNTQRELELSHKQFWDLFENMFDPVFLIDENFYIKNCNKAAKQLLGLPLQEQEFVPIHLRDITHPADVPKAMLAKKQLLEQGFYRDLEVRVVGRDNQIRYVQINSNAIFKDGKFAGSRDIARDITHLRQEHFSRLASEAVYKAIFEGNEMAIGISDVTGKLVYGNAMFYQMIEYTEAELFNLCIDNITHPDDRYLSHDNFKKLIAGKLPFYKVEKRFVSKSGKIIHSITSVSAIFDENGEPLYTVATIADISPKIEHEQALMEAKQIAEKARTAERQFLANMSHEIRTPINAVIGMTHLLFNTKPTPEQLEYLHALRFSADTLIRIISNVLDLSKIEAGELEFDFHPFSLRQLMYSLQRMFQFQVRDKSISVVILLDSAIQYQVIGDQTRLSQILSNLLSNAGKFTEVGTIGIAAYLYKEEISRYWVEFKVHDTGIGIPTESLELIFNNFKQASADIHRRFGGTGLGLSIVKQLVELQGGSIRVDSVLGKGTTFTVILPFDKASVKDDDVSIEEIAVSQVGNEQTVFDKDEQLAGIRILVVEDNSLNQKLISKFLSAWSCQYEIAGDGLEGLQCLEKSTYDIILMDIHMPNLDGCETTWRIRNLNGNPNQHKPIIALTAAALLDEKNRVFEAGMNEFLTKPFAPLQLKNILKKYAEHTTPESALVDLSYLRELSGDDQSFIQEILVTYLRENPKDIVLLEQALAADDVPQIGKIAHKMKSTYQLLGMHRQQDLALRIEQFAKTKQDDLIQYPNDVQLLIKQTQASYPAVRQLVKSDVA